MGYCQVNNLLLLRETIMKKQLVLTMNELNDNIIKSFSCNHTYAL